MPHRWGGDRVGGQEHSRDRPESPAVDMGHRSILCVLPGCSQRPQNLLGTGVWCPWSGSPAFNDCHSVRWGSGKRNGAEVSSGEPGSALPEWGGVGTRRDPFGAPITGWPTWSRAPSMGSCLGPLDPAPRPPPGARRCVEAWRWGLPARRGGAHRPRGRRQVQRPASRLHPRPQAAAPRAPQPPGAGGRPGVVRPALLPAHPLRGPGPAAVASLGSGASGRCGARGGIRSFTPV